MFWTIPHFLKRIKEKKEKRKYIYLFVVVFMVYAVQA